jgi:hypothetical protein
MQAFKKVEQELSLYEHPHFEFSVSDLGEKVDVCIRSKVPGVHSPEYHLTLSAREIDHPQFRWSFQGLLYGCLNDYLVELFTRSPGDK